MSERLLRFAAFAASAIVLASWAMFAVDESRDASGQSVREVAGQRATADPSPSVATEKLREQAHSATREHIDDANDVLVKPFAGLSSSSTSAWWRRTSTMLLALLVYGVGGGFAARYMSGRASSFRKPSATQR